MVVQVRLEVGVSVGEEEARSAIRQIAKDMGVVVSCVKVREDCVQLYGTKQIDNIMT